MISLLHTQLILEAAADSDRLSTAVRLMLTDDTDEFLFGSAAIWEVAITLTLGR